MDTNTYFWGEKECGLKCELKGKDKIEQKRDKSENFCK